MVFVKYYIRRLAAYFENLAVYFKTFRQPCQHYPPLKISSHPGWLVLGSPQEFGLSPSPVNPTHLWATLYISPRKPPTILYGFLPPSNGLERFFAYLIYFFVHCSLLRPTRKKNCTYAVAILTAACGCTCSCRFEILPCQYFCSNYLFGICWSISSQIFWAIWPSVFVHFQMSSSRKYPFLPDRRDLFLESPFPLWVPIVLHKFCWSF